MEARALTPSHIITIKLEGVLEAMKIEIFELLIVANKIAISVVSYCAVRKCSHNNEELFLPVD